jgi:hypothetical protein
VEQEAATARQWRGIHVSEETNRHAKTKELLKVVFSALSAPRVYTKDQWEKLNSRKLGSAVSSHELEVSSGSSWLAVKNLHC